MADYRDLIRQTIARKPDISPAEMVEELQAAGFSNIGKTAIKHALAREKKAKDTGDYGGATAPEMMVGAQESAPIVGTKVKIQGLQSRPELNTREARIMFFDLESDRFAVELLPENSLDAEAARLQLKLKRGNLSLGDFADSSGNNSDEVAERVRWLIRCDFCTRQMC